MTSQEKRQKREQIIGQNSSNVTEDAVYWLISHTGPCVRSVHHSGPRTEKVLEKFKGAISFKKE